MKTTKTKPKFQSIPFTNNDEPDEADKEFDSVADTLSLLDEAKGKKAPAKPTKSKGPQLAAFKAVHKAAPKKPAGALANFRK